MPALVYQYFTRKLPVLEIASDARCKRMAENFYLSVIDNSVYAHRMDPYQILQIMAGGMTGF